MITYTLNILEWVREWKGGGIVLNGKKKVSFSMLLDRISSVILCADEAKSIYRILYTHLTLLGNTRVRTREELMSILLSFLVLKRSTNHNSLLSYTWKGIGRDAEQRASDSTLSNSLFISSIYHQIELFPPSLQTMLVYLAMIIFS